MYVRQATRPKAYCLVNPASGWRLVLRIHGIVVRHPQAVTRWPLLYPHTGQRRLKESIIDVVGLDVGQVCGEIISVQVFGRPTILYEVGLGAVPGHPSWADLLTWRDDRLSLSIGVCPRTRCCDNGTQLERATLDVAERMGVGDLFLGDRAELVRVHHVRAHVEPNVLMKATLEPGAIWLPGDEFPSCRETCGTVLGPGPNVAIGGSGVSVKGKVAPPLNTLALDPR